MSPFVIFGTTVVVLLLAIGATLEIRGQWPPKVIDIFITEALWVLFITLLIVSVLAVRVQ